MTEQHGGVLHGLLSRGLLGWARGHVCHGIPAGAFAVATDVARVLATAWYPWLWWLRWPLWRQPTLLG